MAETALDSSDWRRPDAGLRLAIQALTHEHAWRLDHGQADRLHELYTDDGAMIGLPPRDVVGRDALKVWGVERVKLPRVSRHVETNQRLVWKDGVLHGVLYATVYRSESPDDTAGTAPFLIGDYEDEYAFEGGVWLIRRRVIRRAFRVAA
jgi:hypothetical protein